MTATKVINSICVLLKKISHSIWRLAPCEQKNASICVVGTFSPRRSSFYPNRRQLVTGGGGVEAGLWNSRDAERSIAGIDLEKSGRARSPDRQGRRYGIVARVENAAGETAQWLENIALESGSSGRHEFASAFRA